VCCGTQELRSTRAATVRGERKVRDHGRSYETDVRHLVDRMRKKRIRPGPSRTQEFTMKRRLATLSIVSALLALAAQPAFAGTFNLGI